MKTLSSTAGIIFLSTLSFNAQADYISNINIDGGFDIYNFNPALSADDANPLTYNIDLHDVRGFAEFNLPPFGTNVDVYATGGVAADHTVDYDGARPVITPTLADDLVFGGLFGLTGIGQLSHSFDFSNQAYTALGGSFTTPISDIPPGSPGFPAGFPLPGFLDISYTIEAFDIDGLLDDVSILVIETPDAGSPANTVSALLNGLDAYGNRDGRITGTFAVALELRAVPEPASIMLFGLGLAGLAAMHRRKKQV